MQKHIRLLLATAAASLALSACGGGGQGTAVAPAPKAPIAPQSRTPIATGRLTLQLPPKVVRAKAAAVKGKRAPKFINPSGSFVIDIYIDGVVAANLDGSAGADSLLVAPEPDGTQSTSLPLYSASDKIVVVEWDDAAHDDVIAIGEYDTGGIAAGQSMNIPLTLQMNAEWIVVASDTLGDNPLGTLGFEGEFGPGDATSYPVGPNICGSPAPASQNSFTIFAADATQAFVPVAGYGGTATPIIDSISGDSTIVQDVVGQRFVSFDSNGDDVLIHISAPNPAWSVLSQPGVNAIATANSGIFQTVALQTLGVYYDLTTSQGGC